MAPSFKQLDLNLLRVFAAVMEERSALRASRLLCTSQSAVSHALARLRDQLGDDLFLRTRRVSSQRHARWNSLRRSWRRWR
ncbi:LysR family transcriptional regulator [Caballeronia sp. PC1]|uniref:helix-turn-helix domain-containing protein n=1 Tax=Caballeronia sp. PC1 TaxID=2906765 RepID=UPI0035C7C735